MEGTESGQEKSMGGLRVLVLSGLSALIAPLVFVAIIALRKVERRFSVYTRQWTRRLRHEIARWT